MNNFLFENGTKFLFGGGCVKEYLASLLKGYGPSVLLVTEEGERRSGAADEVPYYAVISPENNALYEKYRALAGRYKGLYLLGRLAEYKYYNMDAITLRALELADRLIGG